MIAFARRHWLPLLLAGVAAVAVLRAAWVERRLTSTPAQVEVVRRELAIERVEKAETKAKAARRAARARVDEEVRNAGAARNLGEYINSRGR